MIGKQGLFITFEGIEGSGKSTQVQMLDSALQLRGIETFITREPGGPKISESIRAILLNPAHMEMLPETELLLYMASRSQHTGQWILPALASHKVVLCDRYNDSTIAYQGAARDLNLDFIDKLAHFATFGRKPDLTFLIDLPVKVGLKRIAERALDRMELEDTSFHEKVREQYLLLAKSEPLRYVVIDGAQSPDLINHQITRSVLSLLGVNK